MIHNAVQQQNASKIKNIFHVRIRALIHDGDYILVVRAKGKKYCFLPGGHHEINETLSAGLIREIKEEMGLSAKIKTYLGAVENDWQKNDVHHFEINHIFAVNIPKLRSNSNPPSQEDHLVFFWIRWEDFKKQHFLPKTMYPLIKQFLEMKQKNKRMP